MKLKACRLTIVKMSRLFLVFLIHSHLGFGFVALSKVIPSVGALHEKYVRAKEEHKVVRRASINDPVNDLKLQSQKNIRSSKNLQSQDLSSMKIKMEKRVKLAQQKVNVSKSLSNKEKEFKLHVLEMFLEELRESERDMLNAQDVLEKSLSLDFWNSSTLKENSWKRLESLRLATLKEEKSFKRMLDFELKLKKFAADTNSSSWMGELLKEIAQAADQLENRVAEHELEKKEIKEADGANIEAVFHVKEGIGESLQRQLPKSQDGNEDNKLDLLIDAEDNKYILTKLNDPTSPYIDHILVIDIIMILLMAVPLGFFCQLVGFPSLFGYVLAGLILGPSCLNWIQEMVQIETLGELGVFMIMFCTGLEFSMDKIRKVWRVALQAPCLIALLMVIFGIIIGAIIDAPINECAFVSVCLSLSSTPLVTKFLQGGSKVDLSSHEYSNILMATLVIQDVLLSFFIALLPGMAGHVKSAASGSFGSAFTYAAYIIMRTLFSLVLIIAMTSLITIYVMPHYSRLINHQTKEMQLLGALTLMYLCQVFTNYLGVSMELGCFAAGVMLAYSSHISALEEKLFAIHDFMSVIFFASIGFHVFPSFVFSEVSILLSLTTFFVAGKFLICLLVLRVVLPPQSRKYKWVISSGLAQISEFSFVLGSRARHLKIITREVYFVILSMATLSLLLAPVLWKLSMWRYRVRHMVEHIS